MAKVTPQLIRELRERTSAGMTDCKNALIEADCDIEKAVEIILKQGKVKSAKRASATAAEGEIRATIATDRRSGTLIEVNIQTDFAARNDKFQAFVKELSELAAGANDVTSLLAMKMASGQTVTDVRDELIAVIGEKIDVRRLAHAKLEAAHGTVHSYVHMNGKIGVLLVTQAETQQVAEHPAFAKYVDDTAMQIAAMAPLYLDRTSVTEQEISKQREIFVEQLKAEKPQLPPAEALEKILDGKVAKWFAEICLVDQNSVIENGKSVQAVGADASKEAGGEIKLVSFVRYQLGDGISAAQDDFAEEAKRLAGG